MYPIKYYFNKQLNIYYRDEEEAIADAELFELDNLDTWQIKTDLIDSTIPLEEYIERKKQQGLLPLAEMGNLVVHKAHQEIQAFKGIVEQYKCDKEKSTVEIYYQHQNKTIKGSIPVYGNIYLCYAFSKSSLSRATQCWIKYLVALAQENARPIDLVMIFNNKDDKTIVYRTDYSASLQEYARKMLPTLMDLFERGHKEVFIFYPGVAKLFYKENARKITAEELQDAYEEDMDGLYPNYFKADEYTRQFTAGNHYSEETNWELLAESFSKNIEMVMDKLHEYHPGLFQ
jgi:exodeoxyribonuclease V gamma subunit